MTYERIKIGTFRVCVFLTVLIEALVFMGQKGSSTYIFGFRFVMDNAIIGTPFFIWGAYFFGIWIAKGFIGKK